MRSRFDFSARTKSIIAKRAAYRCSFPDCDCTLIGPGNSVDDVIELGECAHIYAAGEDGPRKSTLSEDTIKSAFNGIYLCRKHHKIIDRNKDKYPAELLLQYKTRHEFLISQEIGDYAYPSFWINRIEIEPNDILRNGKIQDDLFVDARKYQIIVDSSNDGKKLTLIINIKNVIGGPGISGTDPLDKFLDRFDTHEIGKMYREFLREFLLVSNFYRFNGSDGKGIYTNISNDNKTIKCRANNRIPWITASWQIKPSEE